MVMGRFWKKTKLLRYFTPNTNRRKSLGREYETISIIEIVLVDVFVEW